VCPGRFGSPTSHLPSLRRLLYNATGYDLWENRNFAANRQPHRPLRRGAGLVRGGFGGRAGGDRGPGAASGAL